jgi:hypothetical protein
MVMKRITNTDEANFYYKKVNELVDKYIKEHKIRPSELNRYLIKNLQSFLENSGISDVEGINRIVMDVIDHRNHMELDGVLTFESFKSLNENVTSIGNATVEHEKKLADYYNTSIGHVELLDDGMHLYKVSDFGEKIVAVIFSENELNKVYENIEKKILEENKKRALTISEVDNISLDDSIRIWIGDIISDDKLKSILKEKLNKYFLLSIIKKSVQSKQDFPLNFANDRLKFKGESGGYYIWEVR